MSESIQQIAARVRELREIVDYTPEQMADICGVSADKYALYESGEADIPASALLEMANHCGVSLTALLTGEEPRLHVYALTRKGQGVSAVRRKSYIYQNLAHNFVHKKAEPFLVEVPLDDPNEPIALNSHPGQEFNYVIEGSMKIIVDKTEMLLGEGDSILYDSSYPHGMKSVGDKPVKFLALIL